MLRITSLEHGVVGVCENTEKCVADLRSLAVAKAKLLKITNLLASCFVFLFFLFFPFVYLLIINHKYKMVPPPPPFVPLVS